MNKCTQVLDMDFIKSFVSRNVWRIFFAATVVFAAIWVYAHAGLFLGLVTFLAGAYLLATHLYYRKQIIRLRLYASALVVRQEILPEAITWYNLAYYSATHFKQTKEKLYQEIILLLGIKVMYGHEVALARKKTQCRMVDDYGYEVDKKWIKEKKYFIDRILLSEMFDYLPALSGELRQSGVYHEMYNDPQVAYDLWSYWLDTIADDGYVKPTYSLDVQMSGHDYERYIAGLMMKYGWQSRITPGSGDHGADIIASNGVVSIVMQCKFYSNAVGNKSVQEAYSAKDYYDCHYACVITNSTFTPAAKQAALKLGVSLIHHDDLKKYLSKLVC